MDSDPTTQRVSNIRRATSEVEVQVRLNLDGNGTAEVDTGLLFLDHMLTALAKHAHFDLNLSAKGDLEVDDHHTVEDCALALGSALGDALGDRAGIARFGYSFVPLDEALARAVVDLSGRPWPAIELRFRREMLGQVATENLTHFLQTLAIESRMALHVNMISGSNDHHKAEAAFKAVAVALRIAVAREGNAVPSTKGVL
ncbi:MAG: imidazoleglycerol phosphate dehydratase HisB [Planctomycetota bacterium]|jgi:imidazoleglycerol phosphate dehydratase HisB